MSFFVLFSRMEEKGKKYFSRNAPCGALYRGKIVKEIKTVEAEK